MALLVAGCGGDDEGGSQVGSEVASYDVELPGGWKEATDSEKEQAAQQVGAVVDGAAPEGGEIEGVAVTSLWGKDLSAVDAPNAIVIREPVPDGLDFDEFIEISIENVKSLFGEALTTEVSETEPVVIAGEEHPAYEYEADLGPLSAKRVVFISRGEVAYTLTLNTTPEAFDESVADLEEITASWEWTD